MSFVRNIYRRAVPEAVRAWIRKNPILGPLRERYRANTDRHNEFYGEEFYNQEEGRQAPARMSAPHIAEDIVKYFSPASIVDVGCGTGEYLVAMREYGINVHGIELADVALERCCNKGLDVQKHDLARPGSLPWTVDMVFSAEVAEHLVPAVADTFVEKLTGAARSHIMLTAAGPGQPGNNHFNCQPKDYWIEKMAAKGFVYDEELTHRLEHRYQELELAYWFQKNLMVFHRKS